MADPVSAAPEWERRFRAPRAYLPGWAEEAPERCLVLATAHGGVLELHSWDRTTGALTRATDRREGTSHGAIDAAGEWIWWFDDGDGDEFGVWRRQPFGSAPGEGVEAPTGLDAAYTGGLALAPDGSAVVGRVGDGYGSEVHVVVPGHEPRLIYAHAEDAGVGALSHDGTLVAVVHSEHGDSRHPSIRVLHELDGSTVADLHDGDGKGLEPLLFAPLVGDARLLVVHERQGRSELLIWDVEQDVEAPIDLGVPGEVSGGDWYPDGLALLVLVDHEARTRLWRHDLVTGETTPVGDETGAGVHGNEVGYTSSAEVRPDGEIWLQWSSAATPTRVRTDRGDVVLELPGSIDVPGSVPVEDLWVDGPGGPIHSLLRRPSGVEGPVPLVIEIHGGPTAHDVDAFRAYAATWIDHGVAVLQVNYRGSTGYGSAWRDALEARVGHVELEDVVAVRDHLVGTGVVDPERVILGGASWGGYLTLLGLGLYPGKWALGLAGVPVADYVAAYEDEMEGLKAFDRSLFGGSPTEVPEKYADSSPITYVDAVDVPVLVLAGENDPRCPIRQIEIYLAALEKRGVPHQIYRYDAGHGSLVDDERVRQMQAELDFVRRYLPAALDGARGL